MKSSSDRLYDLLPVVYRLRDAEEGEPLRALLGVIAKEVNLVEADIAQMYDNWFIETCEEWVVPYIADLIGYKILRNSGEPADAAPAGGKESERILSVRRDVANVIRYRRRKGALALLELLARDAANYPATRVAQFYERLARTQSINFQHPERGRTVDLREGGALDLLEGPFDRSARTPDVRSAISGRARGYYNIPAIGSFIWRLKTYSVTKTPAYCIEEEAPECYTFSVLGHNTTLYNKPDPETEQTQIAGELNLPTTIRRRAFEKRVFDDDKKYVRTEASEKYYDRSLSIFLLDRNGELNQIPRDKIIPANLGEWGKYRPKRNFVAVDPRLGRIVFPSNQKPRHGVFVSYRYAFSADLGGGEYDRSLSEPKDAAVYRVGRSEKFKTINEALAAWDKERAKHADDEENKKPRPAVIEIRDSGVYTEPLKIELKADEYLQIRAANKRRPVIRLLDYQSSLPDALSVRGAAGSRFMLDGLLIAGRSVQINGPDSVPANSKDNSKNDSKKNSESDYEDDSEGFYKVDSEDVYEAEPENELLESELEDVYVTNETAETGDLCEVTIRHCTLVPGWGVHCDCEPQRPNEPSLELEYTRAKLNVEHSIIGTILVEADERATEPQLIRITDSILDATSEDRIALGAYNDRLAYARLTIARTTVIGEIKTHAITLAENSIFKGDVKVGRRQHGCVRFCYVTPGSRTPRRYECQPDLVEQEAEANVRAAMHQVTEVELKLMIDAAKASERRRVEPQFNSVRYGAPTYCQLAQTCADEITQGADDESEMGVFHNLYQPQRVSNLRARLDEYTPTGTEVAIIFAS